MFAIYIEEIPFLNKYESGEEQGISGYYQKEKVVKDGDRDSWYDFHRGSRFEEAHGDKCIPVVTYRPVKTYKTFEAALKKAFHLPSVFDLYKENGGYYPMYQRSNIWDTHRICNYAISVVDLDTYEKVQIFPDAEKRYYKYKGVQ